MEDRETLVFGFVDDVYVVIHRAARVDEQEWQLCLEDAMCSSQVPRLLLSRAGYRIDIEAVFAAARELGVAVEINADPYRLDLGWEHWQRGKQLGVRTAINPDAHSTRSLGVVEYGVCMARKGWLEKADVVNTWTLTAVKKFLRQRKK